MIVSTVYEWLSPLSQTGSCPAGFLTPTGNATFTQSATRTTSCPSGPYGAPSTSTSAWSPTPAQACPKLVPRNDPSICMANGGMPYSITPVTIKSGGYAASGVATIRGVSRSRWSATGGYTATISFDGVSRTVTDACTRANSTDGIGIGDACDHSTTVTVGPGTFIIAGSYTSPLSMDWVNGQNAPYSGQGTVTQTNCR